MRPEIPATPKRETPENEKPCNSDERNRKSELCAEWVSADAARDAADWSYIGLWLTGASVIGLLVTIIFNYLAWQQAREQEGETIRALEAAERSASAAAAQVVLAERDLILSKRPFVFFGSPYREALFDIADESRLIGWRFAPVWENAGLTPTRDMRSMSYTQIFPGAVPDDFDFPEVWDQAYPRYYIGPQSSRQAQHMDWHIESFDRVRSGEAKLLWWGWAEYTDIMGSGKIYRTEFCVSFAVDRDPRILDPFPIRFNIHSRFNGTDEECYRAPKNA